MHISLNWLRELVDVSLSPEDLARTLTLAGFEVEDIEDRRTWADGVVVGRVTDCQPHPDAKKLSVCKVDVGAGSPLDIVCGAANVRADACVPVATVGTYLPKVDLKIKKAKLRGAPSEGMICSLAELGLEKDSEGIKIFEDLDEAEMPLGSDVRPLLGLDDAIIDLSSTANRADALSLIGIAREVAALTHGKFHWPKVPQPAQTLAADLRVRVEVPKACPTYVGTSIEGVRPGPSPDRLQQRLLASGMRPINNIVDVTNYILLEWGQPLHAFDRDRLLEVSGAPLEKLTLGARYAREGETLKTLDGQLRKLTEQNLLIVANDRPVALAGVMGGEETEVTAATKNIVLEAALFDPVAVRRSARSQGIRTEASTRYERGVNQAELDLACQRAVHLIAELAGGTAVAQGRADSRPSELSQEIELRLDRVRKVLGQIREGSELREVKIEEVARSLESLGMTVSPTSRQGMWLITVPPYRARDLHREIDLIEEIARIIGYDRFCDTLPKQSSAGGCLSREQYLQRQIRAAFRGAGMTELIHYSLVKPTDENQIRLKNPLFAEYSALRSDLLSAPIEAFAYNWEQGNGPLHGFEIGRIFWKEGENLRESDCLAGIFGGDSTVGRWVRGDREQPLTWYEAKGILEQIFQQLDLAVEWRAAESCPPQLHPGRTANLRLRGKDWGIFGQLHPKVLQQRDLSEAVYAFQLAMPPLLAALGGKEDRAIAPKRFQPYSTFPAIDRDIAFFVSLDVSVADLERAIRKAAGDLLDAIVLFDEYRGENVPEGQRSLAFRLYYRALDRTLTDEEVDPIQEKVRAKLTKQFQATLRS